MVAIGDFTLGRGDEERDLVLRALVPQLAECAQRTRMIGTSAMDPGPGRGRRVRRVGHARQP